MKRNFRKFLSVVLSLVMVFTCLASVGITALAEETTATDEVAVKKGPFDFTDATDLAYGNGATVENGKVKIDIKSANGAAWMRFPYEIVSGTDYSVRFKIKVIATGWMNLTLKTAYAQNNGIGFEHTNSAHIASTINYPNTITKNEWTEIEYSFTANNPSEEYKYLGLFIQTSVAAEIYIDNLQIDPASANETPSSATFDFSDASDLEYYEGTYGQGSATVADGKLNVTIPTANYRINTRFPFTLQNGKTYKVKFDLTVEEAKAFGIYAVYNSTTDANQNSSYRSLIQNIYTTADAQTIEYIFTANIPAAGYDCFGLLFYAGNNTDVKLSIDNLEISVLDADYAKFDFTDASDLEYYEGTYSQGNAAVADGKLNVTIPTANYRINTRFPFILQNGKTYKVKFDLTVDGVVPFGIYTVYNSATDANQNSSYRSLIKNITTADAQTIEYTFTAAIPATGYDRFGLLFYAGNNTDVKLSIDNLEISVVDTEKAYYDFSSSSDVADSYISYSSAAFQDEMLKLSIPSANCRAKVKFPFKLQNGETYRVRFDIKADTAMENMVQIAYAGTGTGDNLIVHGTSANLIAGGWTALNSEFKTLEYTFTAACPENNENIGIYINAGSVSGNVIYIDNFYIVKDYLVADTPNAPDMASHTENTITLLDMRGYEYKIDDGEWQTSPVFENLVQGQTYSFYQRAAATDYYPATAASEALVYFIANYGDADRDGNVAAADLALMRNVLMDSGEVYDEFAADLNKNGILDAVDLVKLKKELAQKNPITPEFLSSSYELAWNDEFDGESLDSTKWNTGTYSFDNAYGGVTYIADNNNAGVLEVADGYLALNNYSEENESGGYDYYTAEICTNKTYSFSYGYFEMRAKLTSGNPLWHSFWACGTNTTEKPYKAEIDVIETYSNGANDGTYDYTVHSWWDKDATNLPDGMADDTTGHKVLLNGNADDDTLASEFHNYGCLWTETSITFYLDGEVLREVVFAEDENSDYFLALKDGNPMSLFLSLSTARQEAGTDNPVTIDNETLADQVMLVDYVRVYQDTASNN